MDADTPPKLDLRMEELAKKKPDHPAVKAYQRYRGGPDETIRVVLFTIKGITKKEVVKSPEQVLKSYMNCICQKNYSEMYEMITNESKETIEKEDFVKRNSAIYEGIEAKNINIKIIDYEEESLTVKYNTAFDTVAGKVDFKNEVAFLEQDDQYKMVWSNSVIYPGLTEDDKVRVSVIQAQRGQILDRNGRMLAGKGVASSVGIIPGKLENRKKSIVRIAKLLGIKPEDIEKELTAKWVKEDSFVPIKKIAKVKELDLLALDPDETIVEEQKRQEKLLKISGVMISDVEVREYPLKDEAAHLVGYVQNVTAEDLEKHAGEGYTNASVIGKTGLEGVYEKELKGENGCKIYIADSEGKEKEQLAYKIVKDGKDIKLTIDADLQAQLYKNFKSDKSCSIAMNPFTGEVLAMVSTPSYDTNAFIMGMSKKQWDRLNKDKKQPLYNRFRQVWCPGSTFKPVIAAIGLQSEAFTGTDNFGNEGHSWQKDKTWGIRRRFETGKHKMSTKRFLGYDADETGKLVINGLQKPIVVRLYQEFLDGKTTDYIKRIFEKEGIKNWDGGTKWQATTLMSMLENEKYKGDALLQKSYTVDFLTKKRTQNKGEIQMFYVEDDHDAIISKRIWECVQLEIKRRKKYLEEHGTNSYSHRPESNPFASKIICGDCNKVFARKGWRSSTGVDRKVWQCSERYKVKGVMGCVNRHVEEETLIKAYLMAWNALVENREDFMEQWTEQLQSENLLEGYRAEKFIEYTDGAEPLTEMDTDFMLKTLDHIKVFEDGTLLVVFLDGTEIECKNEEE